MTRVKKNLVWQRVQHSTKYSGRATLQAKKTALLYILFQLSRPWLDATLTSNPIEEQVIWTSSYRFEESLGTALTLPLLCSTRRTLVWRHSSFGIPLCPQGANSLLQTLVQLSSCSFCFVVFSPTFLFWLKENTPDASKGSAYLHSIHYILNPLYFVAISLSSWYSLALRTYWI